MGLSWINPLYLAGLALLAIPVLIHLAQKQSDRLTRFPSLMFLARIPRREKRRFELRDRLLLLLRCLLLLLLALAFARPFFAADSAGTALNPERSDSVVLLDRSYSMQLADAWRRARALALDVVDARAPGDRVGVILFDEQAEVLSDLSENADDLRTLLASPQPGFRGTRLQVALEQAARLLDGSTAGRKRIVLISDFRGAAAPRIPRLPADIEIETQPVFAATAANAALTSVEVVPASSGAAGEFGLAVEVTNFALETLETVVAVTLDGREIERRELVLPAGEVTALGFDRLDVTDRLLRGVVTLGDDALAPDNRAYFVYSRSQQVPVLIVDGPDARANQSVYLDNALRLARDPVFRVERRRIDALRAEDLQNRAAILLNDVAIPGGELGRALGDYVAAGGALLVGLGETAPVEWPGGSDGFLPGSPGPRIEAPRGAAFAVTDFTADHPLAAALGARQVIDLSLARVFRYRELVPGAADRVVARYDDGAVALLERRVGKGRVLALNTTLDPHWNDLALQPAFLPFLHRALRHLTAYETRSHEARIGSNVDLLRYARALAGPEALLAAADGGPLIVETPDGRSLNVERQNPVIGLEHPGFYQVHRAAAAGVEIVLAANVDAGEGNPARLDVERFVEDIRTSAEPPRADAAPTRRQAAGYEREQRLWYLILSVALALMLIEALSANWIGWRRSPPPGGTV